MVYSHCGSAVLVFFKKKGDLATRWCDSESSCKLQRPPSELICDIFNRHLNEISGIFIFYSDLVALALQHKHQAVCISFDIETKVQNSVKLDLKALIQLQIYLKVERFVLTAVKKSLLPAFCDQKCQIL